METGLFLSCPRAAGVLGTRRCLRDAYGNRVSMPCFFLVFLLPFLLQLSQTLPSSGLLVPFFHLRVLRELTSDRRFNTAMGRPLPDSYLQFPFVLQVPDLKCFCSLLKLASPHNGERRQRQTGSRLVNALD